jgi:hypothetical protein
MMCVHVLHELAIRLCFKKTTIVNRAQALFASLRLVSTEFYQRFIDINYIVVILY